MRIWPCGKSGSANPRTLIAAAQFFPAFMMEESGKPAALGFAAAVDTRFIALTGTVGRTAE